MYKVRGEGHVFSWSTGEWGRVTQESGLVTGPVCVGLGVSPVTEKEVPPGQDRCSGHDRVPPRLKPA